VNFSKGDESSGDPLSIISENWLQFIFGVIRAGMLLSTRP